MYHGLKKTSKKTAFSFPENKYSIERRKSVPENKSKWDWKSSKEDFQRKNSYHQTNRLCERRNYHSSKEPLWNEWK